MFRVLPSPSNPTKDMSDLLKRLDNMKFTGYELSYIGAWTDLEYSPGMLKVTKSLGQKSTELELHLDANYLVDKVIETLQGNPFQWAQGNMNARELELLDCLLNDPRHVLTHATNIQKLAHDLYRVQLTGPLSKKVKSSGITLFVEINLFAGDIQGMDIKKRYDSGLEELVRGVYFY